MEKKIKILIVDDEQIILDSINKHLRNEPDYTVFTSKGVQEALAILKENDINIILTDLMMPDIDGLEFLNMLKVQFPNIIAIMITGYATINSALQAQQLGAFDYLAKPFTKDELKKVVTRAASLSAVTMKVKDIDHIKPGRYFETEKLKSGLKGIGEHSWFMREDDGNVLLGIERPFLYSIGKIQNVYLPSVGDELRQGSVYFQLFSSELRSESLLCPISGFVVEVNQFVLNDPNTALQDPYGQGWLIKLNPENFEREIKILGL